MMMTRQNNPKKQNSWFLGCLTKFTLAIWLLIIAIGFGIWLGFNLAHTYSTWPGLTRFISDFTRTAQTKDGVMIRVINTTRNGNTIDVYCEITNSSAQPLHAFRPDGFYLSDSQNRKFEGHLLDDMQLLEPLNPGLSRSLKLSFDVGNAWGLRLNYQEASVPIEGF